MLHRLSKPVSPNSVARRRYARLHGPAATAWSGPERIDAELRRSLLQFPARETPEAARTLVETLLAPHPRDKSLFIINGTLFATRRFLTTRKHESLAVMLYAAQGRSQPLPSVGFSVAVDATGGTRGNCNEDASVKVTTPTVVIAKRGGYGQCGVLIPNPRV